MKNQNSQIEASVMYANKGSGLKNYGIALLALGAAVAVVTILCLGCINTANELINMLYE